ncbi:hypothetical protein Hypma_010054 [Hypsizygus marmoreus]|uniref:Uncharacterized protein n=1 Tax=Hypsizygus marmoreus TaxID=39966 RepID=A0A369JK65_HYPMA|nr:hypothetical protein Hypma_010054 [Hypsizygus marmoreus]
MSIFTRPDSPPPRQPSPDIVHAPLPSPHLRARQRTSSSQLSMSSYSPATPPGLRPLNHPRRPILTVRSYDHLSERVRAEKHEEPQRRKTRSNLSASPPTTPRSLPIPSATQFSDYPPHRRCLSNAIPYRSPPASPTIAVPPPPVPPIPAFVLSPPAEIKSVHRPRPKVIMPIHLPELENISPLSESMCMPHKRSPSSPEKQRSVGMTCLRFFSLRNSKKRTAQSGDV